MVLDVEVVGRWSPEALTFIRLLARVKARHEPNLMRKGVEQAWRVRWCSLLGCAAARHARHVALGIEGLRGRRWCLPRTRWRVITGTLV